MSTKTKRRRHAARRAGGELPSVIADGLSPEARPWWERLAQRDALAHALMLRLVDRIVELETEGCPAEERDELIAPLQRSLIAAGLRYAARCGDPPPPGV